MPSIPQIAAQVRPFIKECQAETVAKERGTPGAPRIVDVREQNEWDAGHIPGAELIPLGTVAQAAAQRLPDKGERIVVHCAAGVRSAVAAYQLQQLGYTNVSSMAGGFGAWRELGFEIEAPLTRDQLERYSRHLLIPEVGIAGQQTGIYPFAMPGGWRLIGRTDRVVWDTSRERPALLLPGDRVRFVPVR